MSVTIRGKSDPIVDQICVPLHSYDADHPGAEIVLYRQNSVSVRVRIVDPEFKGQNKPQRSEHVWAYLATLPDDVQSDISTIVLLSPDELKDSFANLDFDHPVPSRL